MEVPVACSPGARLSFSWGLGTELRMIELQPPSAPPVSQPAVRTTLIWSTTSAAHRAVAAAIAPQAAKLYTANNNQRAGDSAPSTAAGGRPAISTYSLVVREQLLKRSMSTDSPEGRDLALEAAMWSLIELLFNALPASEGYFAEELSAWLADHSSTLDLESGIQPGLDDRLDALMATSTPASQQDYWPCIAHLVRLGRVSGAMNLLMAHDALQHPCNPDGSLPASIKGQFELLEAVFILLRRMPRYRHVYTSLRGGAADAGSGQQFDTMAQYLEHRAVWQQQCRELPQQYADVVQAVSASHPETAQGVLGVLEVLCSSEAAVLGPCGTWLEAAVAVLVHMRPQLQLRPHMAALLSSSCQAVPIDAQQPVLQLTHDVMLAASGGEVQEVVTLLSNSGLMSSWFMSHIYDLLTATDHRAATPLMHHLPDTVGGNQVEYFRLLLAETLLPLPGGVSSAFSWQLALHYLAYCQQHGRAAAEACLEVLPVASRCGDGRLVRKVCSAARQLGLGTTAVAITRAAAAAAWYAGRVGESVWLLGPGGGAADAVRARLVLEPLEASLSHQLSTLHADYRATELPLVVDGESTALVRALSGPDAGQGVQGQSWLQAYVSTTQALAGLQTSLTAAAQSASTSQEASNQAALTKAAQAFLEALLQLMGAVGSKTALDAPSQPTTLVPAPVKHVDGPPPALLAALLSRVIPALELPACAAVVKDSGVSALLRVASRALSVSAKLSSGEAGGQASSKVAATTRCMQDVQMCLARLACRAHVHACEPQRH